MRRRRRIKATGGVQMFSFLDAMICTMGALLVLLHAFARHGEEEIAATQTQLSDTELQAQREELQWRIDQLKQSRDKTEAQLAAERLKLSHVEDHERRLRQKFDELQLAAKELDRVDSAIDRDARQAEAELAAAKDAVVEAKGKLKEAREKAQEVEPTYSVVPYEGAHATSRRPVYIECRAQSIVLQPEGIELSAEDFAGFLGPGNPLASALRGAREYFASQGATKDGIEPYPLLLVRPDGIEAYYAARSALTSWGSDFGYELVGGDWKLKFPDPDPRLAELTRQIVAEARERQAEYLASAPPSRSRARPKYHARSQGGFVQERGSGGGGGGGGGQGGWDSLGSNWGQGKSKRGDAFGDGTGRGAPGGQSGDPLAGTGGAGTGLESGGTGVAGGDSLLGSGNGGANGKAGGGAPGGPVDRYGQPIDGSPATGELSPENAPYGAGYGAGGKVAGDRQPGAGQGKLDGTARSGSSRGGQPGEAGGEGTGEDADQLATAAASAQPGTRGGKSGSAGGSPGGAKGATGSAQGQSSNAESSPFSAGSGSASESSGQPPSLGAPPLKINSPQGKKVKSMAQARGRDWGLPNAEPHAVAANRPLLVECHNDRLVIPAADRSEPPKEIRLGANTQDSMDDLVSGVWKHIEGWGLAGRGMYWKPELVMEVKPGAADRYAEIKGLLADSGLEVRERQPRPAAKPAPRKSTRR